MIQTIDLKTLDSIPFLGIIVDVNNKIIFFNQLVKDAFAEEFEKDKHITDIFVNWNPDLKTDIIDVRKNEKHYVFMKRSMENDVNVMLIGMETSFFFNLLIEKQELNNVNRELDAIIENSYDGIYITDPNGVTLRTNSAIERITNIPKEYYIGKNVDTLMERGILEKSVTKEVLKFQRTVSFVQKNYAGNETILIGSPIFNEKGEVEKIVTNIRDLSDFNKLQLKLNKVNKLNEEYKKEIDQFKQTTESFHTAISLKEAVEIAEKKVIQRAAEKYSNTYEIAEALNTSQPTIVRKLKKYKIHLKTKGDVL
ncbi:PAS domain S-box protein [Rummeliibacillus sp. JY-2-4R]